MTTKTLLITTLVAAFATTASAQLLDESFDPGNFNDYGGSPGILNPGDNTAGANWYRHALSDSEWEVTDPGGTLFAAKNGGSVGFTSTTLSQGESITASFDAFVSGTPQNPGGFTFRFGFTNDNVTGFGAFPSAGSGIITQIGYSTAGDVNTASRYARITSGTAVNGADGFAGSWNSDLSETSKNFSFTIARNALDGLDLSLAIDGSVVSGSEVTIAAANVPDSNYTFSNLSLLTQGGVNSFEVDNVLAKHRL